MSDGNIPIIGAGKGPPLQANLALMGATDAELLTELERRGVDLLDVVFRLVQFTCEERNRRWSGNGPGYTILERGAELAGECGEAVNVAKKIRRHELKMVGNFKPGDTNIDDLLDKLERELGDVLICASNLANKRELSLARGLRNAFNDKSAELGFPERL